MIILDDIIYYQLILIIFSPLFICVLTPLYTSVKAKRESSYAYQKGYYAMQQRYAEKSSVKSNKDEQLQTDQSKIDDGFYCPFCGFRMPTKLNFCSNCGEKLDFET